MISYENEIFTRIATKLRDMFPGIYVANILNLNPSEFPCAYLEEADNYVYENSSDTDTIENHAVVMWEVNVFSNKIGQKRTEAKAILQAIDEEFDKLGFVRQLTQPINLDDSTKYRLVSRYTAVAGKNRVIYRR